MQIMLDVDSI